MSKEEESTESSHDRDPVVKFLTTLFVNDFNKRMLTI